MKAKADICKIQADFPSGGTQTAESASEKKQKQMHFEEKNCQDKMWQVKTSDEEDKRRLEN